MRIILALFLFITASLLNAQTPVQPVRNWMAVAKMGKGADRITRMFVRTGQGKLKYFDMMRNLRDFEDISNVRQIVSNGLDYILALKDDGTVWAWGDNEYGQLGNKELVERKGRIYSFRGSDKPVRVTGLTNVIAISAYRTTSYALKNDGTVWAWGDARGGLTANEREVMHSMTGGLESHTIVPEKIAGLHDVIDINGPMALLSDGTVWTWGTNNYGQLGVKGAVATSTPQRVSSLNNVVAICSNIHGMRMALKNDGTVWSWGENRHGKLGIALYDVGENGRYIEAPQQMKRVQHGVLLAAGHNTNLMLQGDGVVKGCGDGRIGSLGMRAEVVATPVTVPAVKKAIGIYAGVYSGFALLADGSIMAWGDSFRTPDKIATPIKIADLGNDRPQ